MNIELGKYALLDNWIYNKIEFHDDIWELEARKFSTEGLDDFDRLHGRRTIIIVSASGETLDKAFEKLVDNISTKQFKRIRNIIC